MRLEGRQIGRYHFERRIGVGGGGEVYLAVDPRIQQQVAIKVMHVEDSPLANLSSEKQVASFRREASAIARLNHPHIVRLNDYDEADIDGTKITYIVIPFYKEGTLANWLRKRHPGTISLQDVAYFVRQAADALQYAHNHQVIHQDVKPSNFLIDNEENPNRPNLLLSDFGIAKSSSSTGYTATNTSLGTLAYMAPEHLNGQPTYASDQYALAVMTYELLTGRPPFQGPPQFVIRQHFEAQPQPPSTLNPNIPKAVDNVILRALSKRPEDRFDSVTAFANAFQQALQKSDAFPVPPPPPPGSAATPATPQPRGPLSPIPQSMQKNDASAFMQDAPPLTPPPPPPSSLRASRKLNKKVLASGIAVILLLLASLFYALGPARGPSADVPATATAQAERLTAQANATSTQANVDTTAVALNATATTQANINATATVHAQNPYGGTVSLNDPLGDNTKGYQWAETPSGGSSCIFTGGGYQVTQRACLATNSNFSDFAYQVQMTITRGDLGGIIFRYNPTYQAYYYFEVTTSGRYQLVLFEGSNYKSLQGGQLQNSSISLNQPVTLAVYATGANFYLYVNPQEGNPQPIARGKDSTLSSGQIGVAAYDLNNSTVAIFTNVKVWV